MQKWLALQIKVAETVPVIPIYSNIYFDFYVAQLQNYRVENYLGWANAIVAAWLGETETGEVEEYMESAETGKDEEYMESAETGEDVEFLESGENGETEEIGGR